MGWTGWPEHPLRRRLHLISTHGRAPRRTAAHGAYWESGTRAVSGPWNATRLRIYPGHHRPSCYAAYDPFLARVGRVASRARREARKLATCGQGTRRGNWRLAGRVAAEARGAEIGDLRPRREARKLATCGRGARRGNWRLAAEARGAEIGDLRPRREARKFNRVAAFSRSIGHLTLSLHGSRPPESDSRNIFC
jgi:hypothetical protein